MTEILDNLEEKDNHLIQSDRKWIKSAALICLSKMFERASFYGVRALLVLYLIGETFKFDNTEAISLFGYWSGLILVFAVIGSLIGDFTNKNRIVSIVGAALQLIGIVLLIGSNTITLYLGIGLMAIGNGMYSNNLTSIYGKQFLNNKNKLDFAFTLFYVAINLGAFIGVITIGYIGEEYGYQSGFVVASIMMVISFFCILVLNLNPNTTHSNLKQQVKRRYVNFSGAIMAVASFWVLYEIGGHKLFLLVSKFAELESINMLHSNLSAINSYSSMIFGIIACFLWYSRNSSRKTKLLIGFILGAVCFALINQIPLDPGLSNFYLFIAAMIILGISEIYFAPIVLASMVENINPKYFATISSLAFLPGRLLSGLIGIFGVLDYADEIICGWIGFIGMAILSLVILFLIIWEKNSINMKHT